MRTKADLRWNKEQKIYSNQKEICLPHFLFFQVKKKLPFVISSNVARSRIIYQRNIFMDVKQSFLFLSSDI